MFQPSFEKKAIADFSALESFVQVMLHKLPPPGTTVDMQPLLSSMFVDATTLFLFGESIGNLSSGSTSAQDISAAFDQAMAGSGMRIALGPLRFLAKTSNWLQACRRVQSFADTYVQKAVEHRQRSSPTHLIDSTERSRKTVLLHDLAEQTDDKEHLRNEVLQAFFVAQGTTANCAANILFLTAREPGLWSELRTEAINTVGQEEPPTYEQLQRLSRLRSVINEALRLLPILPYNSRVALSDTTLPTGGGKEGTSPIFIEKGTLVSASCYNLHRRTDLWGPDAASFKPERWDALKPSDTAYEFLPFGAGPRQCIGRDKAFMEASYVVVRLRQRFCGLESRDAREWQGRVQLSAQNVHGCLVAFLV